MCELGQWVGNGGKAQNKAVIEVWKAQKASKSFTLRVVFHSCTALTFAGSKLILSGDMISSKYVIVWVWNAHFSGMRST